MQAVLAVSLAALSFGLPAQTGEDLAEAAVVSVVEAKPDRWRPVLKTAGQIITGPSVGLLAGFAVFYTGAMVGFGGADTLGDTLIYGSPVVFAVGEAWAVQGVGRAVDRERHGSGVATLAGALAGTAVGLGIYLAGEPARHVHSREYLDKRDRGRFLAGVTVATAATIVSYELSRPRAARRAAPTVAVAPMIRPGSAGSNGAWGLSVGVAF